MRRAAFVFCLAGSTFFLAATVFLAPRRYGGFGIEWHST
jgi:hypothetical protein